MTTPRTTTTPLNDGSERRAAIVRAASVLVFGGLTLATSASAQEFAYCDLSVAQETNNLQLNGATVVSTGARRGQGIVVTPEQANQRSTVFHTIPITFAPGDSIYQHFRVRISGGGGNAPPNGADGFAFMVQNDPGGDPLGEGKTGAGLTAVGRAGEGFGYAGITQSVALELDTYLNGNRFDPNGNHLAFDLGGHTYHTTTGAATGTVLTGAAEGSTVVPFRPITLAGTHSLESNSTSYDTRDVWIDYVCAAGTCTTKVYMTFNNSLLAANFADPTVPASLPTKPAAPILTVNGLSDVTQYLAGASGYAGFSASTGGSMDQHLVTYWVLSKTQFSDSNTNHLEDLCDCRAVPSACAGNIPICDLGTAQGFCRDCKTNTECATKDPTKPICDSIASGGTGACVECTTSATCPGAKPNCDTVTNTCTAGCTTDAQCPAAQWCSNAGGTAFGGSCTAKLPNGTSIPTVANHAPALGGTCTAAVGTSVCASGVCDTADNKCGIALGDGTCALAGQCRTGLCITTGANSGKCEPCVVNADCGGATPACNTQTNQCVQCTATRTSGCTGVTPICDVTTDKCIPCNGDAGSGASAACPAGSPFCDAQTGACGTKCTTDAQCGAGNWCNDVTLGGTCAPKETNGTPVPGGACTPSLGSRVCLSAVCDTTDAKCGYAEGDGPCGNVGQCRAGVCVTSGPNTAKCEPCQGNGTCTMPTPACNATTNHCVECTATNPVACTGTTPFCDTTTSTCVSCTSDLGVSSAHPCTGAGAPYCPNAGGACGSCTQNADCAGATHSGPFCAGGACSPLCSSDADCGALKWCDGAGACDPKLPNGSPLPPNPPIAGKCTPGNGARACLSGVCDVADDECGVANGTVPPNDAGTSECRSGVVGNDGKCGYPNGEGPCTQANQGTVCRSSVCGPDGKCGYPNGDGPCTTSNEQKVCRSGACDPGDGLCGIDNGTPPPNDGGSPECRSGVVGSDGKCGYPNGEGPCTAQTGAVVCRSGSCNVAEGVCGANDAGVPRTDAGAPRTDSGAPRSDGSAPRTDSGIARADSGVPRTDGGAGCPGGVVGADGQCGYPNGEGPCTPDDATVVCRSGACNAPDGKCGYPPGTGSCVSGAAVCRSSSCDATGVCGCSADTDCGASTSGRVCDTGTHTCRDGCRGSGGNGCPSGVSCSSATPDIGACSPASVTDSLAGGGCACSVPSRSGREPVGHLVALAVGVVSALGRRRARSRRRSSVTQPRA